jgi:predicted RND superfamily exporter protein
MKSTQTIFSNAIKENKNDSDFSQILKDLVFELSRKKIQRLKDDKKIQNRVGELFEQYTKSLEIEGIKNVKNISSVINGLLKAVNYDKEEFLYKIIYEIDELKKSAQKQKEDILSSINSTYNVLEKHINSLLPNAKETAIQALNDTKLNALEILGILRETTEEALLTTLEKRKDIEDTTFQITKNLTFQAINDGGFLKKRILNITNTIMSVSIELANENLAFAKELVNGTTKGTKEGILKAIHKFKNDIKFAPEDDDDIFAQNLDTIKKDLLSIEDDYIQMLKDLSSKHEGVIHNALNDKIEKYDSSVQKIKRATAEAKEAISQRLEELKTDVNMDDIKEKAEEKIENLKNDVNKLGKKANEAIENIKQNETTKKATQEAKKLGLRAWEVAKNMLESAVKSAKEGIKKDDDKSS